MFLRLLLLLTIVPLVELMILLRLAERFTWQRTLALIVLTGILGAWLARREGIRTLTKIQSDLEKGVSPTGAVVDAALILAAGIVLITPGILTDLAGFALLIPPIRRAVRRRLTAAFAKRVTFVAHHPSEPFIDVEPVDRNADDTD